GQRPRRGMRYLQDRRATTTARVLGRQADRTPRPRRRRGHVPRMARQAKENAMRRLIVGISGASGVIYGVGLLEVLRRVEDVETHIVLSPAARRTLALETDLPDGHVEAIADAVYRPGDIAAAISSGSSRALVQA